MCDSEKLEDFGVVIRWSVAFRDQMLKDQCAIGEREIRSSKGNMIRIRELKYIMQKMDRAIGHVLAGEGTPNV